MNQIQQQPRFTRNALETLNTTTCTRKPTPRIKEYPVEIQQRIIDRDLLARAIAYRQQRDFATIAGIASFIVITVIAACLLISAARTIDTANKNYLEAAHDRDVYMSQLHDAEYRLSVLNDKLEQQNDEIQNYKELISQYELQED